MTIPDNHENRPFLRIDFFTSAVKCHWTDATDDVNRRIDGYRQILVNTPRFFAYYTANGLLVIWVHRDLLE